ncbi:MAG: GNAT family N-acetyltransferase [Candidatus Gastranaerophilales bacterium]|nr:GNAT family N-acetyltransferase [Candidatus Gastranaerophilales bacterium]
MKVKIASKSKDIELCYKLREIIFINGQNVPHDRDRDSYDNTAIHFLLLKDNIPVGVARVVNRDNTAHIERVGILQEYRKKGAGTFLMQSILNHCKREGFEKITLSSQEHAVKFYEKLGFEVIGQRYFDANIPHLKMQSGIISKTF